MHLMRQHLFLRVYDITRFRVVRINLRIDLNRKIRTITSNEEKERIKSMEMRHSIKTYSSMLIFFNFCEIFSFYVKNVFFLQSLKLKFVKKSKLFAERLFYGLERSYKMSGQYIHK